MKRLITLCLALLSALFANAQNSKDFGVVVVYFLGGSGKVDIIINDVEAFTIGKNSVYELKCFSEGAAVVYAEHNVMETESDEIKINLKHGDTIYFRVKNTSITGADLKLIKKTSEEAQEEIEDAGGEDYLDYYRVAEDKTNPFVEKTEADKQKASPSKGTAIAIGSNGALLTSFNQVTGKSKIYIKGVSGFKYALFPARVEKADTANDLVVLQLEDKVTTDSIPFVVRKTAVEMGEKVYLVGFGNSGELKLAEGLVTATAGTNGEEHVFQASMVLEKPYNGAPVIDKDGYLVGVLSKGKKNTASLVKAVYLEDILAKAGVTSNNKNRLAGKTLAEQVKILERYIYLVETE